MRVVNTVPLVILDLQCILSYCLFIGRGTFDIRQLENGPWQKDLNLDIGHKLAYVVHINTWMDTHISSYGWGDWGQQCDRHPSCHIDPTCDCQNITYAEFRSHGPGATPEKLAARPKWTYQLSDDDAGAYTPLSVMHGWVPPSLKSDDDEIASALLIEHLATPADSWSRTSCG